MEERINSLGKVSIFSTLDANSCYWKLETNDDEKDKTAFRSHQNVLCFISIPFGLRSAHGTFQRFIDLILISVKCQLALVYLEDIDSFTKTPKQHIKHVCKVLLALYIPDITLQLKIRYCFTDITDYSRQTIRSTRLKTPLQMADTISVLKHTTSPTQGRNFPGLCNVIEWLVQNSLRIASFVN